MSEQINDADTGTSALPQTVRAALAQRAGALPSEIPPLDTLRRRGRRRRRMRDALAGVGALALVGGAVLGVSAFAGTAPGRTPQTTGPATVVRVSQTPKLVGVPQGSQEALAALKHWKPGPKYEVQTYTVIPAWMNQAYRGDAGSALSGYAAKAHPINQAAAPALGCLNLGSSSLLWPTGFYAEGTPLTVFDPQGHAVYVLNTGFTGADGKAVIGYGSNKLDSGFSLTGCPSSYHEDASASVLMIFNG